MIKALKLKNSLFNKKNIQKIQSKNLEFKFI